MVFGVVLQKDREKKKVNQVNVFEKKKGNIQNDNN